jgi:capsular polysaccharide biosynthesis protein
MNEMKRVEDMCRAALPLDPQRLARVRSRVLTTIAERQQPASRAARGRPWLVRAKAGGRWPSWVAPPAAAAAVAAVIAGAAIVSSAIHPPARTPAAAPQAYTATAAVFVIPARTGQGIQLLPFISGGVSLDDQAQVVKSGAVMSIAVRLLHGKLTPSALDQEVSVTVRPKSQVLDISCRAPTGEGAVACANAVTTAYLQNRRAAAMAALNQQLQPLQSLISSLQKTVAALTATVSHLPKYSPQRAAAQVQRTSAQARLATATAQVAMLYSQKADISVGYILSRATTFRSSA